ncbi:MAG: DNA adenine methylase, partial [Treponema sp.]|nr:DNA adenine methylase [Candidatus Treponema equifaecale]
MTSQENKDFLTSQIITYLGNKRTLIYEIEGQIQEIRAKLNKDKFLCLDLFSGSGIVARMLKGWSSKLIVNDLENYSAVINSCYLSNKSDFDEDKYNHYKNLIEKEMSVSMQEGIITQNYAPQNDENIQQGERAFYTHENALRIDTYRNLIEKLVEPDYKKYFLAPLITEASIHVNTSGVFKGFYKDRNTGIGCFGGVGKNALPRILGKVQLEKPVLSNFESEVEIFQEDAVELSKKPKGIDIAYLDPPYNQHP